MASYTTGHQTPAGTDLTMIVLEPVANVRGSIHQIIIGSDATPADIATEFAVLRTTVVATVGTTLIEKPVDPLTAAASSNLRGGTMTEPTYEAVATNALLQIALNQRATFTWIANPGRELTTGITAATGIGLRSVASGGTPNINSSLAWDE